MPDKDYTFVPDSLQEVVPPDAGMKSCVLHKDERFNITLFGFSTGHELKTHSVPIPALIYVVDGEGEFDLGSETVPVKSGSFIRMEALLAACAESEESVSDAIGPDEGPEIVPLSRKFGPGTLLCLEARRPLGRRSWRFDSWYEMVNGGV